MFGFFSSKIDNIKQAVSKTAQALIGNITGAISGEEEFSEFLYDEMEDILISSDLGVGYAAELIDELREKKNIKPSQVKEYLKNSFTKTLEKAGSSSIEYKDGEINIYFIAGVNGAGKTTLIGKLAYLFKQKGKKVLIAAADTFRAAATEQIEIWANRASCELVKRDEGSDPASVVYDAIKRVKEENADVLICDTAGRLHNKKNLMDELAKIQKVIDKELPDSSKEVLLVIDGTTGQNAISQVKAFKETADITGIVLTKLDGTAKGGAVIGIANENKIPVKFIGVGEKIDDMEEFNSEDFLNAIL